MALGAVTPWHAIALLAKLPPTHPDFEKAIIAFVIVAAAEGWPRKAIDNVLQRYGFEMEIAA